MIRSAREGMPDGAINIHATAIVLDDEAVLITGDAGTGKTSLALALLAHWQRQGRLTRLLADDQVFVLRSAAGRLIGHAPHAIAGLAEIRDVGIVEMAYQPSASIGLVVQLGPDGSGADCTVELAGVILPLLRLPRRGGEASVVRVAAAVAAIGSAGSPGNAPVMVDRHDDLGLPTGDGRTT